MRSLLRRFVKPLLLKAMHRRNERLRQSLVAQGRQLQPGHWGAIVSDKGDLSWAGVSLYDLAQKYGTPLQVVNEDRLAANFRHFQTIFRSRLPRMDTGFSYKTNPLPGAIAILHRAGAFAEVISHFELWLALKLGVAPDRIVFNGPGKTFEGLKLAVARGVRMINIDHAEEADAIQQLALGTNHKQPVGVRVVTSVGWAAQFGIPLKGDQALRAFERIQKLDHLEPAGLHIHLGTGIKKVAVYAQAVDELFTFAARLRDQLGIRIRLFDLGGGFGVPTVAPITEMDERLMEAGFPARPVDMSDTPDLSVYVEAIAELVERHKGVTGYASFFFEPGRAVSSSAQMLLLKVLAIKPGPAGSLNVILDGGHNLAISTSYEQHQILPTRRCDDPEHVTHHFFGPLCHPGDVLARCCSMPRLQTGDVVAVTDAGAYFIPNQMNFSNPRPAAVIVKSGSARLTRGAESFDHMVSLDLERPEPENGAAHA